MHVLARTDGDAIHSGRFEAPAFQRGHDFLINFLFKRLQHACVAHITLLVDCDLYDYVASHVS